jgi:hypothetical protein
LLSRLHRKAEALDGACLRALGHPHDDARSLIRSLFQQVHGHSADLSQHIQSGVSHLASDSIATLRKSLGSLTHVLASRHKEPPKD